MIKTKRLGYNLSKQAAEFSNGKLGVIMVDLKCKREDCNFNKNCNCMAEGIDVITTTACSTYTPSPDKNKHESDRIPQALIRHNTNVRCTAPCLFESNTECIANGITVLNEPEKYPHSPCTKPCPCCATYLPK